MLGVRGHEQLVRSRVNWLKPELGLVNMGVAFAPPLRTGNPLGDKHDGFAVRQRRGFKLIHVALGGNFERRSTCCSHPEDVTLSGNVIHRRGEVEPLAVMRPRVERDARIRIGDALERSGSDREHINVIGTGARGLEGDARAIWRIERARFFRRAGDEEMRLSAVRGHDPQIAAGGERNFLAIRRERRRCEGWLGGSGLGEGKDGDGQQKSGKKAHA